MMQTTPEGVRKLQNCGVQQQQQQPKCGKLRREMSLPYVLDITDSMSPGMLDGMFPKSFGLSNISIWGRAHEEAFGKGKNLVNERPVKHHIQVDQSEQCVTTELLSKTVWSKLK